MNYEERLDMLADEVRRMVAARAPRGPLDYTGEEWADE